MPHHQISHINTERQINIDKKNAIASKNGNGEKMKTKTKKEKKTNHKNIEDENSQPEVYGKNIPKEIY